MVLRQQGTTKGQPNFITAHVHSDEDGFSLCIEEPALQLDVIVEKLL